MLPPLARTCGRAALLLGAALAVSACGDRGGCSEQREATATPATPAPGAAIATAPGPARRPWPKPPPEPPVDATENEGPFPSAEELAVMAAALDHELAELKRRAAKHPAFPQRTVFLDIRKEVEAALLPMLPQHVPRLKDSSKMYVDKGSGDEFDSETGQPAVVLWVDAVSILEQGPARPGPEATAAVGTVVLDAIEIYAYRLSKASGRWAVISRELRAVS